MTAIVPSMLASRHSIVQLIAPTWVRSIHDAAKIIKACARQVIIKAETSTTGLRVEVSSGELVFTGGAIYEILLLWGHRVWLTNIRVSLIDGGG